MNSKFLKVVRIVLIVILSAFFLILFLGVLMAGLGEYDAIFVGAIIPYLISSALFVIIFMAIEQIMRNTEKITEYIYKKEYEESKKEGKLDLSKIDTSAKLDVWHCDCGITNQGNSTSCKGCGKQKK